MRRHTTFLASVALVGALLAVSAPVLAVTKTLPLNGTLWVANRGDGTIRGFDAATGESVMTVPMRAGSQPGDLAYAKGKLYVAEEFGVPPAIAVVDADSGVVRGRITTGPRPHHVHASVGGNLIAYGVFGTNRVGVIDTSTDILLGEWVTSDNAAARTHAAVFAPNGRVLYVANDVTNELSALDPLNGDPIWTMLVPKVHELVVTANGKTAFISSRADNLIQVVDLEARKIVGSIAVPLPDTLRLSANEQLLTAGLRTTPATVALIDTETYAVELVTIGRATTVAGHQWTSPSGRLTFASFEGPGAGLAIIDRAEGDAVVRILSYPGRPHGVAFARP
jgi:DNA-binding beta-propeller fold protein YncE